MLESINETTGVTTSPNDNILNGNSSLLAPFWS